MVNVYNYICIFISLYTWTCIHIETPAPQKQDIAITSNIMANEKQTATEKSELIINNLERKESRTSDWYSISLNLNLNEAFLSVAASTTNG